jgi:hypothetical protein
MAHNVSAVYMLRRQQADRVAKNPAKAVVRPTGVFRNHIFANPESPLCAVSAFSQLISIGEEINP